MYHRHVPQTHLESVTSQAHSRIHELLRSPIVGNEIQVPPAHAGGRVSGWLALMDVPGIPGRVPDAAVSARLGEATWPYPDKQAVLETALQRASAEAQARFQVLLADTPSAPGRAGRAVSDRRPHRDAGHVPAQMLLLALVSVCLGMCSDSVWGVAASGVRAWFTRSPRRYALVGGAGGLAMIAVGVSVTFTGRKD